ncbi:MAG: hypothetical protein ACQEXJ_14560 [Myxococcota bacterium]
MKRFNSRVAPAIALAALLAAGFTGCDEGGAPPADQEVPPRVALELDGRTLFDFRFVGDRVIPCHLGVEHEACAAEVPAPRETVQLGLADEQAPQRQQDPSADQSDDVSELPSQFAEGVSAQSFSTGHSVSPSFSTEVRIAAAASLRFTGGAAFFADPPGVSASQSVDAAGGSCNPIQELCALMMETAALSPDVGDQPVNQGQCVHATQQQMSESDEFAGLVNSGVYCRVLAFLRCLLPTLTDASSLGGDGEQALPAFFACAHHLGGMVPMGGEQQQQP